MSPKLTKQNTLDFSSINLDLVETTVRYLRETQPDPNETIIEKDITESTPGDHDPWDNLENRKGLCLKYFDFIKMDNDADKCQLAFTWVTDPMFIHVSKYLVTQPDTKEYDMYSLIKKMVIEWKDARKTPTVPLAIYKNYLRRFNQGILE